MNQSLALGLVLLFCCVPLHAAAVNGRLTRNVAVGADSAVHLKAGQVVQILNQSGARMVVDVQLPDGSSGIFQIDATAVQAIPVSASARLPNSSIGPADSTHAATTPAIPLPSAPTVTASKSPAIQADPNLPADAVTLVHATLKEDTKLPPPYGGQGDALAAAGSYSYNLYLPPGYYAQPKANFPALFIMSPDGNASLGKFTSRAKDEGWIVVMLVEARNGDWGLIYGDMMATCADVKAKGLRIQEGLQFATGFSGGARGTSMMSQFIPGFNGELLQGAGFAFEGNTFRMAGLPRDHPYAIFLVMGKNDSNNNEIEQMKNSVHVVPFKWVAFEGGHEEPPVEKLDLGLDWLIEQAFTGDTISDDLRLCGARQFGFLAARWEKQQDPDVKADQATLLAAFGDKLSLPSHSAEGLELTRIKAAAPFNP